jgi:hypothetical protein
MIGQPEKTIREQRMTGEGEKEIIRGSRPPHTASTAIQALALSIRKSNCPHIP